VEKKEERGSKQIEEHTAMNAQPIPLFSDEQMASLSRKERKRLRRQGHTTNKKTGMRLRRIEPLTPAQEEVFECWYHDQNLLLHGAAGSGKTFLAVYLALDDIIHNQCDQKGIEIIRSVVPTRDMGFLPGNVKEKAKAYEAPYEAMASQLFGRGDAYSVLSGRQIINFTTTSYLRGTTFNDKIIIVDEIQNMTFHELDSIITRLGENCRVIFCGDYHQSDLWRDNERDGIRRFMDIIRTIKGFDLIEFSHHDIVRSGLVKEYIISKIAYEREI